MDTHSAEGSILSYLDGREEVVKPGSGTTWQRWRSEDDPAPAFYQISYRCLVPQLASSLLVAGRLLDADREGFRGVRVRVNCNVSVRSPRLAT